MGASYYRWVQLQCTYSPIDGSLVDERPLATDAQLEAALERAQAAQRAWSTRSIEERRTACTAWIDEVLNQRDAIARELTLQMGRPIRDAPGELRGFEERARYMVDIAEQALNPLMPPDKPGFERWIERSPLGVVLTIAPWNYPLLTAVNSIVPALMAGNAVVLKHSAQTPLVAERFASAARAAALPPGVFEVVHCSHAQVERMIRHPAVGFVAFTGSVAGGRAVQRAVGERFIGAGLELGGKDPAYVRRDVDVEFAADNLVDGAFYNAGQSCCGIERIYVARELFEPFVERFVAQVKAYRLGNPLEHETTLGPLVRSSAAEHVRRQIQEARSLGACLHIDEECYEILGPAYAAPQVLTGVEHNMALMREETFGPAVGIMAVDSDDEAVLRMNDSRYGLTASIWTRDGEGARRIGRRLETGTVFLNRCDYLDPALAWTGVKDSGRGCTLSTVGYEVLTRPRSFHFRAHP